VIQYIYMKKIILGIVSLIIIIIIGYFIFNNNIDKKVEDKQNNLTQKIQNSEKKIEKIKDTKEENKTFQGLKGEDKNFQDLNKKEENKKDNKNEEKTKEEKKENSKNISQKTLLILDASGSMWGKINGKAKIDIAKKVVKDTLKNFKETELGLMAYGHRKKGDCKDIEILSEPKKNNIQNISTLVDTISPKGNTPMGDSVLKAAEFLKYSEEKATIILVSDGIETCGVDLCALGKKLEETGVDFTAHVIGFGMTEKETIGLKCLADETGGKFVLASDSKSLSDALNKAVEASSCSKEKLGEATITTSKEVSAGSEFNIQYTGPVNTNDFIALVPKGSTNSNDHISYLYPKSENTVLEAPIEAGEYDIVYWAGHHKELARVSVIVK